MAQEGHSCVGRGSQASSGFPRFASLLVLGTSPASGANFAAASIGYGAGQFHGTPAHLGLCSLPGFSGQRSTSPRRPAAQLFAIRPSSLRTPLHGRSASDRAHRRPSTARRTARSAVDPRNSSAVLRGFSSVGRYAKRGRVTESDPPPISPQNKKRTPNRTMRSVSGRMSVTRPKFALPNVPFGFA